MAVGFRAAAKGTFKNLTEIIYFISVFASTKAESEKVTEDVKTGEEEETNCLNITTARLFKVV